MRIDNNMPDDFFEWLNNCPVQWGLNEWNKDVMNYSFIVPNESEQDNEE